MSDESYPLLFARVGSSVKDGIIGLQSVFESDITKFKSGGTGRTFMSGNSRYAHSDQMNRGSIGLSGSYGVSGLSKLTGSVSAYVGNAKAETSRDVSVNYNAIISAGVEHVDTASLTVADFASALSKNTRRDLEAVIDSFNEVNEVAKQNQSLDEPGQVVDNPAVLNAIAKWSNAIDDFFRTWGQGVVMAVQWGALGWVNMTMSQKSGQSSWKYGGDAEFSFEGTGAGMSVKATYDGAQSEEEADVAVTVESRFMGPAIEPLVSSWARKLEDKSFKELADVQVLKEAPPLEVPANRRPPVPTFREPSKKESLTSKIGKVKNLEGLQAFAIAEQYEKAKKDNPELTLAEFMDDGSQSVDVSQLDSVIEELPEPDLQDSVDGDDQESIDGDDIRSISNNSASVSVLQNAHSDATYKQESLAPHSVSNTNSIANDVSTLNDDSKNQTNDFIPLGVVIVNWSEIFPWLSMSSYNGLEDIESAQEVLQWRRMIQDFQALAILYYTAEAGKLELSGLDAAETANSFANQLAKTLQGDSDDSYISRMQKAFSGLSANEQSVYKFWRDAGFLRRAELGLGVVETERGVSVRFSESGTDTNPGRGLLLDRQWADTAKCSFQPDRENHSAFANFSKLLPVCDVIDGEVVVLLFNEGGFLGLSHYRIFERREETKNKLAFFEFQKKHKVSDRVPGEPAEVGKTEVGEFSAGIQFHVDIFTAFRFKPDFERKCLRLDNDHLKNLPFSDGDFKDGVEGKFEAHPIPFSAAKGVPWKGGASGAASLESFDDLNKEIGRLRKELTKLQTRTYSSESFSGITWHDQLGLSSLNPDPQYVGMIPEQKEFLRIF